MLPSPLVEVWVAIAQPKSLRSSPIINSRAVPHCINPGDEVVTTSTSGDETVSLQLHLVLPESLKSEASTDTVEPVTLLLLHN